LRNDVHLTLYGAKVYARILADGIKNADIMLSDFVNNIPAPTSFVEVYDVAE